MYSLVDTNNSLNFSDMMRFGSQIYPVIQYEAANSRLYAAKHAQNETFYRDFLCKGADMMV